MSDQLRDLIDKTVAYWHDLDGIGPTVVAIRIPWLCPDCKGTGTRSAGMVAITEHGASGVFSDVSCAHPNAPTLADTVALWEAVHKEGALWHFGVLGTINDLRAVRA